MSADTGAQQSTAAQNKDGCLGCSVIIIVILLFALLVSTCTGDEEGASEASAVTPTAQPVQPASPQERGSLQPSWRKFADGWNAVSDYNLRKPAFDRGTATVMIGNNQGLLLAENPDGSIREATLILGSSETRDVIAFIGNMAALIAAAQPELTPEQRGNVLRGLKLLGDDADTDFTDETKNREFRNGSVKYWANHIPGMGLVIGAAHADG